MTDVDRETHRPTLHELYLEVMAALSELEVAKAEQTEHEIARPIAKANAVIRLMGLVNPVTGRTFTMTDADKATATVPEYAEWKREDTRLSCAALRAETRLFVARTQYERAMDHESDEEISMELNPLTLNYFMAKAGIRTTLTDEQRAAIWADKTSPELLCIKCDKDARQPEGYLGAAYVRAKVNGKWENEPICLACYAEWSKAGKPEIEVTR